MIFPKVERLLINYKTLDEFRKFKGCGAQELSMFEELQANMIENDSESPFYGIYYGGSLIARMSLYMRRHDEANLDITGPYIELSKLEVLPSFQKQGFGRMLVNYAKNLQFPIKTIARIQSAPFWNALSFQQITTAEGEFYIWHPATNLNAVTNEESA
ncbi:N-acetyltransferase [Bacillus cytotoxicus]|uniref:N-acetyltransferase n=1 Tax=Bacillus cytotoxicus TaxID=580165 RepID=UPI000864431A|nr:N-acetyltransferase [Bacillus cytotoxicus]AWC29463.1 GNAT family N-acetyltransferase [Bacillus cytotoxicus]AWC41594.1 GNAT family N-acetyltransferase [Bacillus cytotoxicus]AWC49525.1 GNAT family N-acetyltransferase [Bacillus cytotoxicus]AWC53538.1 GNAT family N-acetyltransferase [Bacillus cytotoxicus]AWC57666.1 GNAT family N-acetyltransferase [Bacillus cytotoxicus]